MVNAVELKRPLEMTWSTASLEAGEVELLEQSMAEAIFSRLKQRGLIEPRATLDSKVDGSVFFGDSYRDVLGGLIGDADGDQHLDIDVYELMVSDVLKSGARVDTVEAALANEYFSDGMLLRDRNGAARESLLESADSMAAAGKTGEAKELYRQLQQPKYAEVQVNGVRDLIADYLERGKAYPRGMVRTIDADGSELKIAPYSHDTTFGAIAARRIAQLEQRERMTAALGREVDPFKAEDARAYFGEYEKRHSTAELKSELGNYLASFYVHAGEGADWSASVAEDDRAKKLDQLFANVPLDEAGRKIIDCEGFAAIAESIFGASEKFDMYYVQRPGHVVAAVVAKDKSEMFVVNNQRVLDVPMDPTGEALRKAAGAAKDDPFAADKSFSRSFRAIRP